MTRKSDRIAIFFRTVTFVWVLLLCCAPMVAQAQITCPRDKLLKGGLAKTPQELTSVRITLDPTQPMPVGGKRCAAQHLLAPDGVTPLPSNKREYTTSTGGNSSKVARVTYKNEEKWIKLPSGKTVDPKAKAGQVFIADLPSDTALSQLVTPPPTPHWVDIDSYCQAYMAYGNGVKFSSVAANAAKGIALYYPIKTASASDPKSDITNVVYKDVYPGMTNKITKCVKELFLGAEMSGMSDADQRAALYKAALGTCNALTPKPDDCEARATKISQSEVLFLSDRAAFRIVLQNIHKAMQGIVTACLVIYLVLFAIKMMLGGVRNLKSEGFVVMITIVMVAYFVYAPNLESYATAAIKIQEEFVGMVTSSIGDSNGGLCQKSERTNAVYNTWQRIDCMMAHVMGAFPFVPDKMLDTAFLAEQGQRDGIDVVLKKKITDYVGNFTKDTDAYVFSDMAEDPYTAGQAFTIVLFIAMIGMLMTPIGPVVLISGGFIPVMMIAAIIQAVLAYLTAVVALMFLCIIGPMIIPMVLFKTTKQIFESWLQMVMGYMLQPAVLFAYLVFMLHVLDVIMTNTLWQDYRAIASRFQSEPNDPNKQKTDSGRDLCSLAEFMIPTGIGVEPTGGVSGAQNKDGLFDSFSFPCIEFIDLRSEIKRLKALKNVQEKKLSILTAEVKDLAKKAPAKGGIDQTKIDKKIEEMNRVNFGNTPSRFEKIQQLSKDPNLLVGKENCSKFPNSICIDVIMAGTVDKVEDLQDATMVAKAAENPEALGVSELELAISAVEQLQEDENKYHREMFVQSLIIIGLTLALTFGFMVNVMNFGAQLAGIFTPASTAAMNVYNEAMRRCSAAMNARPAPKAETKTTPPPSAKG